MLDKSTRTLGPSFSFLPEIKWDQNAPFYLYQGHTLDGVERCVRVRRIVGWSFQPIFYFARISTENTPVFFVRGALPVCLRGKRGRGARVRAHGLAHVVFIGLWPGAARCSGARGGCSGRNDGSLQKLQTETAVVKKTAGRKSLRQGVIEEKKRAAGSQGDGGDGASESGPPRDDGGEGSGGPDRYGTGPSGGGADTVDTTDGRADPPAAGQPPEQPSPDHEPIVARTAEEAIRIANRKRGRDKKRGRDADGDHARNPAQAPSPAPAPGGFRPKRPKRR
ncbi:hypothetical protein THAOC_35463, partial [Thalassiosira oceanica]